MSDIGERIIDLIALGGLFVVSHPDPDECHVFVWSSGAAEQIEAVVEEYVGGELAGPESERDKLKHDNERLLAHMAKMYEGCPWEANAGDDVDELFQVAGKLLKELDNY